jgi:hypothetical protein
MAEEIGGMFIMLILKKLIDFETENIIANFKFRLTNWTLD